MSRDPLFTAGVPPSLAERGAALADRRSASALPDADAWAGTGLPAAAPAPGSGTAAARSAGARLPAAGNLLALDSLGGIPGALEGAAAAIARLDTAVAGHPLAPAWEWRARLEAVRRQAAADGRYIDPWHLAAAIEGVRFRMEGSAISDRGAIFEAARHALGLWNWFARPDAAQAAAIEQAATELMAPGPAPSLVGAALAARGWLDRGGERPPLRAALALHWQRRGLMRLPAPLLIGAAAFRGDAAPQYQAWVVQFLEALAEEAEWGLALMRLIEREWLAARAAIRGRRRDSRAAAAVDILAAAPVVSATSLAAGLGMAVKNAAALLEGFVARGIAIEVTHRAKRRLFGLGHLAPLREETLPPRRSYRWGGRRGEVGNRRAAARDDLEFAPATGGGGDAAPSRLDLTLSPAAREELEPIDFGDWMREADALVRRSQAVLDRLAGHGAARSAQSRPDAG
jgi:hypothetical protein